MNAHHFRHERGLGSCSADYYIGGDVAGGRFYRRDPAVDDIDAGDGGVLIEPASQVLESPRERLDRPLGIGVTAVGEEESAECPAGHAGNHVADFRRVELFHTDAVAQRFVAFCEEVAHLLFRYADLDSALVYELGGIAQLVVQRCPQLYRFDGQRYQRRLVGALADYSAVSPGGFAADHSLFDDHDILASLGEEIG